jgi:hypothetical protein
LGSRSTCESMAPRSSSWRDACWARRARRRAAGRSAAWPPKLGRFDLAVGTFEVIPAGIAVTDVTSVQQVLACRPCRIERLSPTSEPTTNPHRYWGQLSGTRPWWLGFGRSQVQILSPRPSEKRICGLACRQGGPTSDHPVNDRPQTALLGLSPA